MNRIKQLVRATMGLTVFFMLLAPNPVLAASASLAFPISVQPVAAAPTPQTPPMFHHFDDTMPNALPGGWFEVDNAQFLTSGTGSAKLNCLGNKNYGQATSNTMDLDQDFYRKIKVVITHVDPNTGNELWVNDGQGNRAQIAADMPVGIWDYDLPVDWTGRKNVYIELWVMSNTAGLGTRFDEVWIYAGGDGYQEHFEETAGQPTQWWEVNNIDIEGNGLDSAKVSVATGGAGSWGQANSDGMSLDISELNQMTVVMTQVDPSTGNKIFVSDGTDRQLVASDLPVGKHVFPMPASWIGVKNFHIEIVIESALAGAGARWDGIRIHHAEP